MEEQLEDLQNVQNANFRNHIKRGIDHFTVFDVRNMAIVQEIVMPTSVPNVKE